MVKEAALHKVCMTFIPKKNNAVKPPAKVLNPLPSLPKPHIEESETIELEQPVIEKINVKKVSGGSKRSSKKQKTIKVKKDSIVQNLISKKNRISYASNILSKKQNNRSKKQLAKKSKTKYMNGYIDTIPKSKSNNFRDVFFTLEKRSSYKKKRSKKSRRKSGGASRKKRNSSKSKKGKKTPKLIKKDIASLINLSNFVLEV